MRSVKVMSNSLMEDHKGEPMLAQDRINGFELTPETVNKCINTKTGQFCKCTNCPYCKTVQIIKFTRIVTVKCTEELYDHEANHLAVNDKCKFCDYIVYEANEFENKDGIFILERNCYDKKSKLQNMLHMS